MACAYIYVQRTVTRRSNLFPSSLLTFLAVPVRTFHSFIFIIRFLSVSFLFFDSFNIIHDFEPVFPVNSLYFCYLIVCGPSGVASRIQHTVLPCGSDEFYIRFVYPLNPEIPGLIFSCDLNNMPIFL